MTAVPSAAPTPKSGLWEDFIDIFYQPSQVFERRRDGQFGLALLLLVVISTILYFALRNGLAPIMDAEMSKQIAAMAAKNQTIPAEQLASARSWMEKVAMFGTVIFIPIGVCITAVLLWLAGKLFDAKVAFAAAMMIVTYSQIPKIAEMVLSAIQGLFLEPEAITSRYSVTLGVARFLDQGTNPILMTIVGGLDVFTIWVFVLLAIGLSVVARVPIKRAAMAAGAIWIVSLLPALYGAISSS